MQTNCPDETLILGNEILDIERELNLLEHFRLDMLGNGDPSFTDAELAKLNCLQQKIKEHRNIMTMKQADFSRRKGKYYTQICKQMNAGRRSSRKLVIEEYGRTTE